MTPSRARIICHDGTVWTGEPVGAPGQAIGWLCAVTSMTGYQEILASGVYADCVVLFTTPHVGNTGVNDCDGAPLRARGLVLREHPRLPSSWRARGSLDEALRANGTTGIAGVDTRALTRHLRKQGRMRVGIFVDDDRPVEELLDLVRAEPPRADDLITASLTATATVTATPTVTGAARPAVLPGAPKVAIIDFGAGGGLAAAVAATGAQVRTHPATASLRQVLDGAPERILLSGGPGNPAEVTTGLGLVGDLMSTGIPMLGIGLGCQLLARASGHCTSVLDHPHHGANHPVRDMETGRVLITTHSHDYGLCLAPTPNVRLTHVSLNDGTPEGFALRDRPIFGLQFHPLGAGGPTDGAYVLESFLKES